MTRLLLAVLAAAILAGCSGTMPSIVAAPPYQPGQTERTGP